jgi:hypothetical protein
MSATYPYLPPLGKRLSILLWANDGSNDLTTGSLALYENAFFVGNFSPFNGNVSLSLNLSSGDFNTIKAYSDPRLSIGVGFLSTDDYAGVSFTYTGINFTVRSL